MIRHPSPGRSTDRHKLTRITRRDSHSSVVKVEPSVSDRWLFYLPFLGTRVCRSGTHSPDVAGLLSVPDLMAGAATMRRNKVASGQHPAAPTRDVRDAGGGRVVRRPGAVHHGVGLGPAHDETRFSLSSSPARSG